ncbi:MAG: sugar synthetase [Thermaceae bacterium]|nr:sugar synthetase [Thermaceae bacterium]
MARPEEILLLTNGPGELSTWVVPVLSRLRRAAPQARIELFLIRDQFAAGTEVARAKALELDAVSGRAELLARMTLKRRASAGLPGLILMLGGAPRDAVGLSRATGYPAFSYSFDPKAWHRGLKAFLVDSERTQAKAVARGAQARQVQVVGNLVVDALEDRKQEMPDGGRENSSMAEVLLLPSSRPFAARYLLGFMLSAAEIMAQSNPQLRFAWVRSSLLPDPVVEEMVSGRWAREIGGVAAQWQAGRLVSENGLEVTILDESQRYRAMRGAKVALSVPGTNTLELGLAGLPSVVLLPLHKPELIPLEGIWHWLFMFPGGKYVKQDFVLRLEPSIPHLALPNQWLGERVFPELRGVFGPDMVAQTALDLLRPERQTQVKEQLQGLEAQPGADNLVRYVLENIKH